MQEVHFKTNIQLKNIIGKDLITDDNIAVLELVKNSYDAGSSSVEIIFNNVSRKDQDEENIASRSSMLICDKGSGMDEDGLINKWLNIAYSEKKEQVWLNGRRQAGNKGVGRFSCDRLGKQLTIYSKTEGGQCRFMSIDWGLFENDESQDRQIQDVTISLDIVSDDVVLGLTGWNTFDKGTILYIEDLREIWDVEKIIRLKRDLEKFINPNQAYTSCGGFSIEIKASEYLQYDSTQIDIINKVNGFVENKIFDRLNFKTSSISAAIDSSGQYITTTLTDRGRMVFELKEPNIYPHLRNVKTFVYYLNPYTKAYFTKQTGFRSVDFGSIFLFINGFRIPPYGDEGDDWLGIEKRKSLGFRRYLSTREVVGRIEINDEFNDFNIITSRAGIVRNEAFEELSKEGAPYGFFYKTFRRLERFVVEGIKWDKAGDIKSDIAEGEELYRMDDFTRDKQMISCIRSIIDLQESSIIELNINEELVNGILDAQAARAEEALGGLLSQLTEATESLDVENIERIRERLQSDTKELDDLIAVVNRLSPSADRLCQIQAIKELVSEKEHEVLEQKREISRIKAEKEAAEAETLRLKAELQLEKEKNTYLLTSSREMSEDAKSMVHNIKLIALDIESVVGLLYKRVNKGTIERKDQLSELSLIKFLAEKAIKISKLITRANFKSESDEQMVNVVGYIDQYINIYKDIVEKCKVEIHFESNDIEYRRKISLLDLALVIDNLVSNAQKANARNIYIEVFENEGTGILIKVSDDGQGIDKTLAFNPDKMFELGVTTTDGSGIGLYSVKNALKEINCDIQYAGQSHFGGAEFNIIIV